MDTELIPGEILTVNAASVKAGIHHATLQKWAMAGKVAYVRLGGLIFIPVTEVIRLRAMDWRGKNKKRKS